MKKMMQGRFEIFLILVGLAAPAALAQQSEDDVEIINLDSIYQTAPGPTRPNQQNQAPNRSGQLNTVQPGQLSEELPETATTPGPELQVDELKDLSKLSPFSEVSIIQKKFMPKSERFQIFGGLGLTTNTPWFLNAGFRLNLGYHFTESLGVEFSSVFLSSSERQVAEEIRANNILQPEQFIYTKGYMGLDLLWTPFYGKMTLLNRKIVPYEMYFTLGGGSSNTNSQEKTAPTFHFGTGQLFTITKSMAFRWDYSLNVFQATPLTTNAAIAEKGTYNDLIFSAGVSFFFPEARNR